MGRKIRRDPKESKVLPMSDYIHKDNAIEYVLEHHYDEVREAVFEQEAENRRE